jgi:hypothetical protein
MGIGPRSYTISYIVKGGGILGLDPPAPMHVLNDFRYLGPALPATQKAIPQYVIASTGELANLLRKAVPL